MRIIEIRRTCCGVPVWMLDTTCWSNSRLSGTEKLRSASMLLANDPAHSRWLIHERVPQAASALVESQVLDTHRALGSLAHALTACRDTQKKGGCILPRFFITGDSVLGPSMGVCSRVGPLLLRAS